MTARDLLFRGGMAWNGIRLWRPLAASARHPAAAQAATLAAILGANADTAFGRAHHLNSGITPDRYRSLVPVHDYEMLRPFVERQRTTGEAALTREAPLFYAQTSGSTGTPKYIPVTPATLEAYRAEQALFTYLQHRVCPAAFTGRAWGIMGAAVEATLDSGHAVGSVSGHLYNSLPRALQARFVVPPDVASIHDYDSKYAVILRLALEVDDVTYLGSPNPSTFLKLLTMLNERRDEFAHALETGTLPSGVDVPPPLAPAILARITKNAPRARLLGKSGALTYADLWPQIRLLTTWTGGSCGIALESLRRTLPRDCVVMELGYQATEFRGTMALEAETTGGLPPLNHHFLEFVELDEWESGGRTFIGLEELVFAKRYYVFVTTIGGLYRYAMNDILEVTGSFERTPLLRFVQKGKGITSITGEKLYESQAIEAVSGVAKSLGVAVPFFLMVADEKAGCYRLYAEMAHRDGHSVDVTDFARAADETIGRLNIEYGSKRASGRLQPLVLQPLRAGAGDAFKISGVNAGQREGQFKPALLHYARDLKWPIDDYVE